MRKEVKEWYDMACTDLGVAKHLEETYHPKPLEIICYHCQQAAEKAIKALMLHCGLENGLPKRHDLSFLLNQIKNKVMIQEKYYDDADMLTMYGVSVRYPNDMDLEERHAKEALRAADEIVQWVRDRLEG